MSPFSALVVVLLTAANHAPSKIVQRLPSRRMAVQLEGKVTTASGAQLPVTALSGPLATELARDGWQVQSQVERADFVAQGTLVCVPGTPAEKTPPGMTYPVRCVTEVAVRRPSAPDQVLARFAQTLEENGKASIVSEQRAVMTLVENHAAQIAAVLRTQLEARLGAEAKQGRPLRVTLRGVKDAAELQAVRGFLAGVRGVRTVTAGTLSAEDATVEVTSKGDSNALAQALDGKKVSGRTLAVTGVDVGSVSLSLAPASR